MRIQPKKILWPTDFSALSLKAAPYARALCEAFDAELHVIHVAPPLVLTDSTIPMMTGGDKLVTVADTSQGEREALRILTKRRFGHLRAVTHKVVAGNDWHEICAYAKRERIDLIVIATHGLTGLKHVLMGSTAERVVRHAPCPVLTVKSFQRGFLEDDLNKPGTTVDRSSNTARPVGAEAPETLAHV